MKLSNNQVQMKKSFRLNLLHLWNSPNAKMFDVVNRVMHECGLQSVEMALAELEKIPSIKKLSGFKPVAAWLAQHYPKTSNSMFDGKTIEYCLSVWSKEKYTVTTYATGKRSKQDLVDMRHKAIDRQRKAVTVMKRDIPVYERWASSAWKTVK